MGWVAGPGGDGTHGGAVDLAGEGLDGDRETLDAAGGEPTRAVEGRGETSGESSGRSPLRPVGGDKTCVGRGCCVTESPWHVVR